MLLPKTLHLVILFGAIASSVVAFSVLASTGYDNDNSSAEATSESASAEIRSENDHDSYLDPCYGCTPTEDDFEDLTTFELLAKFPELSGDPIENDTEDASQENNEETTLAPDQESDVETNDDTVGTDNDVVEDDNDESNTPSEEPPAPEEEEEENNCDDAYPDVCIQPPPPNLNCDDVPYEDFTVRSSDPHGFDGDNDGVGCEN